MAKPMYRAYWQLTERPFENSLDWRFYYPSQSHQAAVVKLRYALENRSEAALLVAEPGMGKTLLVAMLQHALGEQVGPWIEIPFPQMRWEELVVYVADLLEGRSAGAEHVPLYQTVRRIQRLVAEAVQAGRHPVLVVEDAHLITYPRHWDDLRLLLNIRAGQRVGWTLLLVAQPGLLPLLERMPSWEDRLSIKCLVRPFSCMETAGYVAHRLKVAGATRELFDPSALDALHQLSQGVPRRINRLADLALLLAYAEDQDSIRAEHVEAVAEEIYRLAST